MIQFVVDPEFEGMMPAGSETENRLLEAELITAGKPDQPLIVWKGKGLLVDGHRRWRVIRQHGLKYEVVEQEFESRAAVMQWILTHQLARRSISEHERSIYTAQLHALIRARKVHGDGEGETAVIVAEMTGQSRRSVFRKVKYAQAVEQISPGWQAEVRRGRIPQKIVHRLARLPDDRQHELLESYHKAPGVEAVRRRLLRAELGIKSETHGRAMRGVDAPEIGDQDMPEIDTAPAARQRQVSDTTVAREIDDALAKLSEFKATCQRLIARNTLDSPELRNRVFGSIQSIQTNLLWVRRRKASSE